MWPGRTPYQKGLLENTTAVEDGTHRLMYFGNSISEFMGSFYTTA